MLGIERAALVGMLVTGFAAAPADEAPDVETSPLVTLIGGAQAPLGLAVDGDGQVFVGEYEGTVRRAYPGQPLEPVTAFASVGGIEFDASGLYVADPVGGQVWQIRGDRADLVAGTGEQGDGGDGGPATEAELGRPRDVAVGAEGELYIADSGANRIRMVRGLSGGDQLSAEGTISTVAGTGEEGVAGDGGPATEAQLRSPFRVAVSPAGELYIVDSAVLDPGEPAEGARIRKVARDGTITTVAGGVACDAADDPADLAQPSFCAGVGDIAVDADGVLYMSDQGSDAIWALHPDGRLVRLPIYVDGLLSITAGTAGDLLIGRRLTGEEDGIQRVSLAVPVPAVETAGSGAAWEDRTAGTVALVAGTGDGGFAGDGGPATEARLAEPGPVAVGPDGLVYVADRRNDRVRSIDVDGTIETIAGNGEEPPAPKGVAGPAPGDGRLATEVPLWPSGAVGGLAAGPDGSVYLCGESSHRVFRVSPLGVITTFAGTGAQTYAGDGGLAVDAVLAAPVDVAVGTDGSVYIADRGNDRIRRVDPDGVIATMAELDDPDAVEVAPDGTVYALADGQVWRVERSGSVNSITPDELTDPGDIAVGPDGLPYVSSGAQVLAIQEDGTTTVVAGTGDEGERVSGDEKPATDVDLPPVDGVAFDLAGNLYLSHTAANQVTVVVRVTEQPDELPWHWLVLGFVAAVALVAVALSFRQTQGAGYAAGSATAEPPAGLARP